MQMLNKLWILVLLLAPAVAAPRALAVGASPDAYYGINDLIQQGVRLGNKDLRTAVAGIINVFLGFLGVIAVVIILQGGFKWMLSMGSSEKIDEAKKLMGAGIVGIAIVLAAFSLSSFVLNELYNATR